MSPLKNAPMAYEPELASGKHKLPLNPIGGCQVHGISHVFLVPKPQSPRGPPSGRPGLRPATLPGTAVAPPRAEGGGGRGFSRVCSAQEFAGMSIPLQVCNLCI